MIELCNGDCLEVMKDIPDESVDMILCDLPYGVTACKWDSVLPLDELWGEYERIVKSNGIIVLFGTEPFASKVRMSNIKRYKYDWIWEKSKSCNFLNARKQPLKYHENIMVFGFPGAIYNPQFTNGKPYTRNRSKENYVIPSTVSTKIKAVTVCDGKRFPKSIIKFKSEQHNVHPTQKPVALLEYLIKTYTDPGETVLDNCMGSGSTGVACVNTNRNFIGIELQKDFFDIAKQRIEDAQNELKQLSLFDEGE